MCPMKKKFYPKFCSYMCFGISNLTKKSSLISNFLPRYKILHFHYFSFGFFDFMMIASFVTLVVFMWIGSGQLNLKL